MRITIILLLNYFHHFFRIPSNRIDISGGSECDEDGISNNPNKKTKIVVRRAKLSETELECLEKGCYVGFFFAFAYSTQSCYGISEFIAVFLCSTRHYHLEPSKCTSEELIARLLFWSVILAIDEVIFYLQPGWPCSSLSVWF